MTEQEIAKIVAAVMAAQGQAKKPAKRATGKAATLTLRAAAIATYYHEKSLVSKGKTGEAKHAARATLRKAWGFHAGETAEQWAARCLPAR